MQEHWDNFKIQHKGINYVEEYDMYRCDTAIKDIKTGYTIIDIVTCLGDTGTFEFHIGTNEKLVKKLNLPSYKHKAEPSYMEYGKYFDNGIKKARNITCLSIGAGNVKKILNNILAYWKENGHTIKSVYVTRETGNTRKVERWYNFCLTKK